MLSKIIYKFVIPNKAPRAVSNTAKGYFCCHHEAQAAVNVYMAHVDGKKAVLEMNIPAENNWKAKHILPIWTPNSLQTALERIIRYTRKISILNVF